MAREAQREELEPLGLFEALVLGGKNREGQRYRYLRQAQSSKHLVLAIKNQVFFFFLGGGWGGDEMKQPLFFIHSSIPSGRRNGGFCVYCGCFLSCPFVKAL